MNACGHQTADPDPEASRQALKGNTATHTKTHMPNHTHTRAHTHLGGQDVGVRGDQFCERARGLLAPRGQPHDDGLLHHRLRNKWLIWNEAGVRSSIQRGTRHRVSSLQMQNNWWDEAGGRNGAGGAGCWTPILRAAQGEEAQGEGSSR